MYNVHNERKNTKRHQSSGTNLLCSSSLPITFYDKGMVIAFISSTKKLENGLWAILVGPLLGAWFFLYFISMFKLTLGGGCLSNRETRNSELERQRSSNRPCFSMNGSVYVRHVSAVWWNSLFNWHWLKCFEYKCQFMSRNWNLRT